MAKSILLHGKRLKQLRATTQDLIEVYTKQIWCVLELATLAEKQDLERIKKCATHIILGKLYTSYKNALELLKLDSLEERRLNLSLKFAVKSENIISSKHGSN